MDDATTPGTTPEPERPRRRTWRPAAARPAIFRSAAVVPPPPSPADMGEQLTGVPEPVASRRSSMAFRLIAVAVALVLAFAITFVVVVMSGPPTVADLRTEAGLDKKQQLLIGVKDDQPGVAFRNPDGSWTGFDIDIAYMIAEDLSFRRTEVRFLAIESEDRARMQATDTDGNRLGVDLVIASYSITPEREAVAGVSFSASYLSIEQSVVTRTDHAPVSTLEDLRRTRVCSLATATSETAAVKAGAIVISRKKISECFTALDDKEVEAISTDAAILGGYKARFPDKYDHYDIGLEAAEAWGVNVGENDALRTLVNLSLYHSREDPDDDRWEEAYRNNLRVEIPVNLPAPIAVDSQPRIPPEMQPKVRQWPWERVGP
jgi:glutamate transport system substrate-binding protein